MLARQTPVGGTAQTSCIYDCYKFLSITVSGIKTAVLYTLAPPNKPKPTLTPQDKKDIAASFQQAVFQNVIKKTLLAAEHFNPRHILFGGGRCVDDGKPGYGHTNTQRPIYNPKPTNDFYVRVHVILL